MNRGRRLGIVIRPAQGVFLQTLPLSFVFGAYRRFEVDPQLDAADLRTITATVQRARSAKMPLAFCRVVRDAHSAEAGVWLPGCRPKVTDRVFDHIAGSFFNSTAFAGVFAEFTERQIFMVGPRLDSSMRSTVSDSAAAKHRIKVVIPDHPLQKCSTAFKDGSIVVRTSQYTAQHDEIPFQNWKDTMWRSEHHI